MPPKGYADWAWVQHMLTSAAPATGRVAVVLPQGALFRAGAEGRIREHFLKADKIEAVIGLAPNLFYGTGLAACVLILRQQQARAHARARCCSSTASRCSSGAATRTPSNPSTPRRS